jgi:hypothetical protein
MMPRGLKIPCLTLTVMSYDSEMADVLDPKSDDLEEHRRQMIVLIRSKRRVIPRDIPTDWRPTQVLSHESQLPFTPSGAWQLIADKLEEGHPLEELVLKNPAGKIAYVMKIDAEPGRRIYIKLQFGNGCVIGRSFHYSEIESR